MHVLSEYGSNVPQRGMAFMPKRALNVESCEIARAYKVSNGLVEPISFTVPRKVRGATYFLQMTTSFVSPILIFRCFFSCYHSFPTKKIVGFLPG